MSNEFKPSEESADFFFLAIDHGFESIEGGGGPLTPFVMGVTTSGEKIMHRFVAELLEEGLSQAQRYVAENQRNLRMYAIAWDGYVTLGDERTDAILVEAADRAEEGAVLFCQRYRKGKKGLLRKTVCERIGNPALIERLESRFKGGD
jgi:hypothetical protein